MHTLNLLHDCHTRTSINQKSELQALLCLFQLLFSLSLVLSHPSYFSIISSIVINVIIFSMFSLGHLTPFPLFLLKCHSHLIYFLLDILFFIFSLLLFFLWTYNVCVHEMFAPSECVCVLLWRHMSGCLTCSVLQLSEHFCSNYLPSEEDLHSVQLSSKYFVNPHCLHCLDCLANPLLLNWDYTVLVIRKKNITRPVVNIQRASSIIQHISAHVVNGVYTM